MYKGVLFCPPKDYEKLAIFGDVRGRRGAELLVLSAVETKIPGFYDRIRDEVYAPAI